MNTENIFTVQSQLKYLRALNLLMEESPAYRQLLETRSILLEIARCSLETIDPTDTVAVAKRQEEIRVRKLEIDESNSVKNIIKKLESQIRSGKPITLESDVVAPNRG